MIEVTATHIVSPLAWGTADHLLALRKGETSLRADRYFGLPDLTTAAVFPPQAIEERFRATFGTAVPMALTRFEQLVALSLHAALSDAQVSPNDPGLLFLLATTKGNVALLDPTEEPAISRQRVALSAAAEAVAQQLHLERTPVVVSNACISGSHALLLASQLLESDSTLRHVVVCGADLLSRFVVSGFGAFKALSAEVCRPFDAARCGLNLGEAAATLVLSKTEATLSPRSSHVPPRPLARRWTLRSGAVRNDANHISGPSRTGEGLFRAICATLGLPEEHPAEGATPLSDHPAWASAVADIACVSCHGTSTAYNDEMEAIALHRANLLHLPAYSLKSTFGHTLGAAGVLETILTMAAVEQGSLWPTRGFDALGVSHALSVSASAQPLKGGSLLKLLSGFGGCNAALLWQSLPTSPTAHEHTPPSSPHDAAPAPSSSASTSPSSSAMLPSSAPMLSSAATTLSSAASQLGQNRAPFPQTRHFSPIAQVDITEEGISIDGISLPFDERGAALLPAAYKNLIWGYPKFHKMDTLSQVAFVATELLVQAVPHLDQQTSVVFLTHHGSLAADVQYQRTISPNADEFFPSPAAFVYTLPNIATGEVAIRHQWHGHTACYALPPTADVALQQSLLLSPASDPRTTAIVGGWIDATDADHFSAHLQLFLPTPQ